MSARRRRSLTAALPSPLRRPGVPRAQLIPTDASGKPVPLETHRRRLARNDRENLELLARHFGLDDLPPAAKWPALCVCLAQQLDIPAFRQQPGKSGRKTRWTTEQQRHLYIAVEGFRALGMTLQDACERLADAGWYPGNDADSIERRYKDARKSLQRQSDWPTIAAVVAGLTREAKEMPTQSHGKRAAPRVGRHATSTERSTL